jgi:hypothetical protein
MDPTTFDMDAMLADIFEEALSPNNLTDATREGDIKGDE